MPGSAFAAGEYLGGAAGDLRGVNPVGWHSERSQPGAGGVSSGFDMDRRQAYKDGLEEPSVNFGRVKRPSFTPARFDGSSVAWRDYKKHFEYCALLNQWTKREKAIFLAVSLKGQAQSVLSDTRNIGDYYEMVRLLELRFGPSGKAEMYLSQLRGRSRKPNESLQVLGCAIRRLTQFAYPEHDYLAQDRLARMHFGDAIQNPEVRMRLFNAHSSNLRVATEIEAFLESERMRQGRPAMGTRHVRALDRVECGSNPDIEQLVEQLQKLETELQRERSLNAKRSGRYGSSEVRCYGCGEIGHYRRECPGNQGQQSGNGPLPTPGVGGRQ